MYYLSVHSFYETDIVPSGLTGGFEVLYQRFLVEEPAIVPVAMFAAGLGAGLACRWFPIFVAGGSSLAIASSGELDAFNCSSIGETRSRILRPLNLWSRFGACALLMV